MIYKDIYFQQKENKLKIKRLKKQGKLLKNNYLVKTFRSQAHY